jgi:uncharacterized membrane protein
MAVANLALRFLLEVAGYAGAGYVAFELTGRAAGGLRWVLAIFAALAVIGLWGMIAAPRTQNGLSQAQKDVIGSVILLAIAGAVLLAGQSVLAIGYAALVVLNAVLLFVFGSDARARFDSRWARRGDPEQ